MEDPLNEEELSLDNRIIEVQTVPTKDDFEYAATKHDTSLDMSQYSIQILDCLLKIVSKWSFIVLGRSAL